MTGLYVSAARAIPFNLQIALTKSESDAGLGVSGSLTLESAQWRIPSRLRLSARLNAGDDLQLEHAVLGASARYVACLLYTSRCV